MLQGVAHRAPDPTAPMASAAIVCTRSLWLPPPFSHDPPSSVLCLPWPTPNRYWITDTRQPGGRSGCRRVGTPTPVMPGPVGEYRVRGGRSLFHPGTWCVEAALGLSAAMLDLRLRTSSWSAQGSGGLSGIQARFRLEVRHRDSALASGVIPAYRAAQEPVAQQNVQYAGLVQ